MGNLIIPGETALSGRIYKDRVGKVSFLGLSFGA